MRGVLMSKFLSFFVNSSGPEVGLTTVQLAAVIHLTIPRSQIQSVMGPGLSEIMEAVKTQGIGPAGSWFTLHVKMDQLLLTLRFVCPSPRLLLRWAV